jgi:hypothetical protein
MLCVFFFWHGFRSIRAGEKKMKNITDIGLAGRNNIRVISLILMVITSLVLGTAGNIWASIEDSPHNPSPDSCRICHMQRSEQGQAPAWNASVKMTSFITSSPEALGNSESYKSPTHDMEHDNEGSSNSAQCLACHNGIFSSLINNNTPDNEEYDFDSNPAVQAQLNKNPSHDHPIGFIYEPKRDLDNNGFPEAAPVAGQSDNRLIPGKNTGTLYPLFGSGHNKFECLTCHTAHYSNTNQGIKGIYQVKLLRADNTISAMCRDCHHNKY